MRTEDFDYGLPPERIAQRPPARRADARLLAADLATGAVEHGSVGDLVRHLAPGDLLVVNDTRVRPARVWARRPSGGRVELLMLGPAGEDARVWRAMVNPARKLKPGDELVLEDGLVQLSALERPDGPDGAPGPEWLLRWGDEDGAPGPEELLERLGRMPLPPYVERARGGDDPDEELDRERYQTVYARETGAVAAPTAGLHLTEALLGELAERGVELARVTLHVGIGTFRPVSVERAEEHRMHEERFEVSREAADAVAAARARGGRVVAVGTTSVRALEASADGAGGVRPGSGETRLFLLPGAPFRVVDALMTNFHMPRSTLLMLVCAFAGRERTLALYREALEQGYRFLSYGDAMLLTGRARD
jgi:S-adenosylmethionine:tRNA ribosyltransferase-isomerase